MKTVAKFLATALIAAASTALAEEAPLEASEAAFAPRETFRKWRIAVGGAFNGPVSAELHGRNLPIPAGSGLSGTVVGGKSRAEAEEDARNHRYDNGGYLGDSGDGWGTRNWKLPTSAYEGNGKFTLRNAYSEGEMSSRTGAAWLDNSSDRCEYGFSVELSRELWIHDEEDEHRWGLDFAAAFSYFFGRDIYSAHGAGYRTDTLGGSGEFVTTVDDPDAMYLYDIGYQRASSGMYGDGASYSDFSPMILWKNVGSPKETGRQGSSTRYAGGFVASGDYRELEMLFMLRPWYELTDWWRVYANVGVGVSWGSFESDFCGGGVCVSEDFSQWDCYGVAGLGTMLRYERFDISLDVFGRFLRDDLDVDGQFVGGSIHRSELGVRLMVGFEF